MIFPFLHGDVVVADAWQRLCEVGELVVVSGKEGAAANPIMQMLDDGPSQRNPIVGAGSSADLIQKNQAAGSCTIQDVSRFDHLYHEGALSGGQVIRGSYARENPVDQSDAGFGRRYEAPDLRQQDDQRDLAEVGALPCHVGPCEDHKPVALTVEGRVVGYECQITTELLNDRVAAFPNEDRAALIDDGFDVPM